jgi:Rod binding domain-containing protein
MELKGGVRQMPQGYSADSMKSQRGLPKNEKVLQAAQMYEQQFLRDMVKAMRATVDESEPASMGEKIFREQLDDQYVENWSSGGGVGFADMIYEHVMDRYYNQRLPIQKPQGPLPFDDGTKGKLTPKANGTEVRIPSSKPQAVLSPWEGILRQVQQDGRVYSIIEHSNGLESQLTFSGLGLKSEGTVRPGEKIGVTGAEAQDVHWFVKARA